jgi:xanthine phosphoribosyltransferase
MSDKYIRTFPISWEQLHRDSRALAWKLLDMDRFTGIVAVTRGGLIPAAIVARELGIRFVDTVCIASYDYQDQKMEVDIIKPIREESNDWVIVDDVVDTGKTANAVREMLPNSHFATVYAKPEGKPVVDTYITEVSQKTWILFPWASGIEFVEPLARQRV